jgi:hypothetical protein
MQKGDIFIEHLVGESYWKMKAGKCNEAVAILFHI